MEVIGTARSRFGIVLDGHLWRSRWEVMALALAALIPAWLVHAVLYASFPFPEIVAFASQFVLWRVLYGHPVAGVANAAFMTLAGFLLAHTGWEEGPAFWSLTVIFAALSMVYGCAVGGETQVYRWRRRIRR